VLHPEFFLLVPKLSFGTRRGTRRGKTAFG